MIAQASPAAGALRADPAKRVNYTLGLVLGVDEFQQEQLYHAAGRRGHNRLLHGYGTVWGLAVTPQSEGADPEIQVHPGVAVDPCGREICVPDLMCVKLGRWLDRHRATLQTIYPTPEAQPIPLAVILCHRECPTDAVPVPGEPCRSQEDAMAPSRIREGFELRLALRDDAPWASPPAGDSTGLTVHRTAQPEEHAVRAFGRILARVQTTTDEILGAEGEAVLREAVLALVDAADEEVLASPPASTDDPVLLPAAEAPRILRDVFRLWVTEVRPQLRAMEGPTGCGESDAECCVLLSEIDLAVTSDWAVASGEIASKEERRPYLLHSRLIQEWLIAGGGEEGRPDVDSWATLQILGPQRVRVWIHHDEWLLLPQDAVEVRVNEEPLGPGGLVEVVYANVKNVWDLVLRQEMGDGDTVEVRFDTERILLVQGPVTDDGSIPDKETGPVVEEPAEEAQPGGGPEAEFGGGPAAEKDEGGVHKALRAAADLGSEIGAKLGIGGGDKGDFPVLKPGQGDGPTRPNPRPRWTPESADRLGGTVADELRGPSGEYLDRYGFHLAAFTVYDRIEGGDLAGEYKLPIVVAIQRTPVDKTSPESTEHYLRFDGAQWTPAFLDEGSVDLEHRYPASTVRGIQGHHVNDTPPLEDQYLVYGTKEWAPAYLPDGTADLEHRYPASTVRGIQGTLVSNTPPKPEQYLKFDEVAAKWIPADLPAAMNDITGVYPRLTLAKIQDKDVVAPNPQPGEVLTFRESSPPGKGRWVPAAPAPGGATGPASGDLSGTYPGPSVVKLRGRTLGTTAPLDGQVLVFRESSPPGNGQWVPGTVQGGGGGQPTGPAGGDLKEFYPNPRINSLQGFPLGIEVVDRGQSLMFDGDAWVPEWAVGAPGGRYEIVAAGVFEVDGRKQGEARAVEDPYNGLKLVAQGNGTFLLDGFPFDAEGYVHVVKAISAIGPVMLARGQSQEQLRISIPDAVQSDAGEVHVEVSRYPRKKMRPQNAKSARTPNS